MTDSTGSYKAQMSNDGTIMYLCWCHTFRWTTATTTLLLLPFLSNTIHTVSAQRWTPWQFQIQTYQLRDFWTPGPDLVTEFVLVLEERPVNGRSVPFAQALQRGPVVDPVQ